MAHYYDEVQDGPLIEEFYEINLFGKNFKFLTASGVFSKGHLDTGTWVLLNHFSLKKGSDVLDIGCGYGVVGISIAKAFDINVTMSDINKRAIMISKKNAKSHNVTPKILQSNLFEKIMDKFDTIIVNPPQHAGKDVCFKLITDSINFLKPRGTFQLVARHKKGGKHLSEKMEEIYGNVEVLGIKSGFRVYCSTKE